MLYILEIRQLVWSYLCTQTKRAEIVDGEILQKKLSKMTLHNLERTLFTVLSEVENLSKFEKFPVWGIFYNFN